jgi:hypothetical protein
MRHHRGSLLMANVNTLHPQVEAGGGSAAGWSTHHEEDGVDAFLLEATRDYFLTAKSAHFDFPS